MSAQRTHWMLVLATGVLAIGLIGAERQPNPPNGPAPEKMEAEAHELHARAAEMMQEAEHLRRESQRVAEQREFDAHIERMHREMDELREQGRHDEAAHVEREIDRAIRDREREMRIREHRGMFERRMHHLHQAADHLFAAELNDWGEEVRRRAEQLEREFHERLEQHEREMMEQREREERKMMQRHERAEMERREREHRDVDRRDRDAHGDHGEAVRGDHHPPHAGTPDLEALVRHVEALARSQERLIGHVERLAGEVRRLKEQVGEHRE